MKKRTFKDMIESYERLKVGKKGRRLRMLKEIALKMLEGVQAAEQREGLKQ